MFVSVAQPIVLGEKLDCSVEEMCPHCKEKHSLDSYVNESSIVIPGKEKPVVLKCTSCGELSRNESQFKRALGGVFLTPPLLMSLGGLGMGIWILLQMVVKALPFSGGFLFIALFLLVVCSIILNRVGRFFVRYVIQAELVPITPFDDTKM